MIENSSKQSDIFEITDRIEYQIFKFKPNIIISLYDD